MIYGQFGNEVWRCCFTWLLQKDAYRSCKETLSYMLLLPRMFMFQSLLKAGGKCWTFPLWGNHFYGSLRDELSMVYIKTISTLYSLYIQFVRSCSFIFNLHVLSNNFRKEVTLFSTFINYIYVFLWNSFYLQQWLHLLTL